MAKVKFPSEMPSAADVGGNDKLMISKDGSGEAFQVSFSNVKQYLEITDIELDPVQGGSSQETATVIPSGPAGQNRKMDASPGWYSVGGVPVEATSGHVWKWFWNGTSWTLVDMGELPVKQLTDSEYMLLEQYVQNGNPVFNEDGVLSSVSVLWTDEEPGVLNFLDYNFTFMSYDSYTVTYKTKTLTQPKVTRDNEGNIIIKPLKTVN